MKRKLINYVKTYIVLQVLFVAFGIVSCLLPDKPIQKNIEKSVDIYQKEHLYPQHFIKKPGHQSDNFTDFLIINMIYNMKSGYFVNNLLLPGGQAAYDTNGLAVSDIQYSIQHPDRSVDYTYGRYWHGSMFAYRFLFLVSDLNGVRWLNFMACSLIIFAFVSRVDKCMKLQEKYALLLGLIFVNYYMVLTSFQFTPVILIALIGAVLLVGRVNHQKDTGVLFIILGGLTCYFDLLTAPLLTLGIPILVWIILQPDVKKILVKLSEIVKLSVLWLIGYIATWMFKWMLIALFTDYSIVRDVKSKMGERAGTWRGSRIHAIQANVDMLELVPLALLTIAGILLTIFYFNRNGIKKSILFLIVALFPFLWLFITANHAEMHNWFTYRTLWISISGLLLAFSSLIDWKAIRNTFVKKNT